MKESHSLNERPSAVLLMGPTASGKSALAMALAKRRDVEIVSVDSAQVYRDMDVGTAKPSAEERAAVPHHLIDIIDPTASYSAAQFHDDALGLIDYIAARGRLPLLVGGTMLYYKALREGLSDLPQADANLRETLDREAAEIGWPAMHAKLAQCDPAAAARLKPNDSQRIQRALEVFLLTGKPLSAQQGGKQSSSRHRFIAYALMPGDRAVLHRRIADRFDLMLKAGLLDELRGLRERYALNANLPSMRSVGYRQAWSHLEGEYDLPLLREKGIAATRQLAKRQLTWLRSMSDVRVFDCLDASLVDQVADRLDRDLRETPR